MIASVFNKKHKHIESVEITGHANYAKMGSDIVCAAVSTAVIMTCNALELLKVDQKVDLIVKDGYFKAHILSHDSVVDGLMQNLEYSCLELAKQYPKYMKNQTKEG